MATVTGFTASRMQRIQDASIVRGTVTDGFLVLQNHAGVETTAGYVRGDEGAQGDPGSNGLTPILAAASRTSIGWGTGSKAFTLDTPMDVPFPVGSPVRASQQSNVANYMAGIVTASTRSTVTINVTESQGSIPNASWFLAITALNTQAASIGSTVNMGNITGTVALGTYISGALAINAVLLATLVGNVTFQLAGMPVGVPSGTCFKLVVWQDGTGNRTITPSGIRRASATNPPLSTTAGSVSILEFFYDSINWNVKTWANGMG